jgi:hypothetical protein
MSLVADKYSENDPVLCSIDDLAVTEIKDELKKIGVKTRLKNRKTFRHDAYLFPGKYYRRQHRIWVFVSFVQKIAM